MVPHYDAPFQSTQISACLRCAHASLKLHSCEALNISSIHFLVQALLLIFPVLSKLCAKEITQWSKCGEANKQMRVVTNEISMRTKKMNLENLFWAEKTLKANFFQQHTDLSRIPDISDHSRLLTSTSESFVLFSAVRIFTTSLLDSCRLSFIFPLLERFLLFSTVSAVDNSSIPVSFSVLFSKVFGKSRKACLFEHRFVMHDNSISSFPPARGFPVLRLLRKVRDKFLNNSPANSTSVSPPWQLCLNDNVKYFSWALFFSPPALFWRWHLFPSVVTFHRGKGHPARIGSNDHLV